MSASKFEKHAGCTSRNQNDRIMLWGERSMHDIVTYLKSLGSNEEQVAAILEMKKKNEDRKGKIHTCHWKFELKTVSVLLPDVCMLFVL